MLTRALLAVALALAAPGAAAAATLERSGGTIRFTAGAGETNYVDAGRSFFPDGWKVTSRAGPVGPALPPTPPLPANCSQSGFDTICTPLDPPVTRWELYGHDGNDILNSFWAAAHIDGGPGNDQIDAGDQDDVLIGGPGDEIWIRGDDGADQIDGGDGNDRLFPDDGADDVRGGPGTDEVTYQDFDSSRSVTVTLNDQADDGVPGQAANIHSDVEDILGGDGNDFLVGDDDGNRIRGDLASLGQNGNDKLVGGGGSDELDGGAGNDQLLARDGVPDTVKCGDGTDTAVVDTIDTVSDCETVDASAELEPDRDADGVAAPADCDDHDASRHPGVPDVPENGIDEDCSGTDAQILDRDGDGFNRPQDCDDANPAINPGAAEIRGNAVDEDCLRGAEPFTRLRAEIASRWEVGARGTSVVRLVVSGAPKGARVELRCKGRGCPARDHSKRVKRGGKVKLHGLLRGRLLATGAVVEVRVRADQRIGAVARFRMRAGKLPARTSLCLPPGARKPAACATN